MNVLYLSVFSNRGFGHSKFLLGSNIYKRHTTHIESYGATKLTQMTNFVKNEYEDSDSDLNQHMFLQS